MSDPKASRTDPGGSGPLAPAAGTIEEEIRALAGIVGRKLRFRRIFGFRRSRTREWAILVVRGTARYSDRENGRTAALESASPRGPGRSHPRPIH